MACHDVHTEEVMERSSPLEQASESSISAALSPLIEQFSSKSVCVHEFEQILSCINLVHLSLSHLSYTNKIQ